jgi:pyruvate/2-oxoglutarate dehydrogenase complex dihydrolipoamide dehydrogenase (E3) component
VATFFLSDDTFDQKLIRDVFPPDWKNPSPAGLYDLVIIGGGPAGMTAIKVATERKARVAVVEQEHFGGECLNVGCIPSKALLASSRVAAALRDCNNYGIEIIGEWRTKFAAVMERVRRLRTLISPHDSADHFRQLGADVFLGAGRFKGPDELEVQGQVLRFHKAVIAAGTQPAYPDIPGLQQAGFLTNQTVFNLTTLPGRLAVIGAGPQGCELAQAFARFGSRVTLITDGPRILPREDSEAATRLVDVLRNEGINVLTECRVQSIDSQDGTKILHTSTGRENVAVDEVLVTAGRAPAVEGYGLERANVGSDPHLGVTVNDRLQTTNPNIYALPARYNLTHVVKELARIAVQNALADAEALASTLTIPWCTYTDPEIAHVGLYEEEARAKGIRVQAFMVDLAGVDRAVLEGKAVGFVKLVVREGSRELLGASLMAAHAGEMISELTVAMASGLGVTPLARAIHPFPTQAEAIRAAAENSFRAGSD